ncbi:MAG: 3-dehydroquinate synthase II, partial [Candidatus Ranarchaeia archaeon]
MKELWIEMDPNISENQKIELLKFSALNCDTVLVDAKDIKKAKNSGNNVASSLEEGDIIVLPVFDSEKLNELKTKGRIVAVRIIIEDKKDEEIAISAAELNSDYVIVGTPNWKIIPLENLIAKTRGRTKLLAEVSSTKEAKVALETLELGSD